jgi:phosphatidylglycerophosphate synthase
MPHLAAPPKGNAALAAAARALTVARIGAVPAFVWLLAQAADGDASSVERAALALLYGFVALSDFADGRLARRARAVTPQWALADALADIVFNFSSLAAGAWLGLMGPWVAAGVALLGGRFLLRITRGVPDTASIEDAPGKLAGVIYYTLVGWMVVELVTGGVLGRTALARGGDVVFLYTLAVFWSGRARPMSSRRP